MNVTDKTPEHDRVWNALVRDPEAVRAVFETYHYDAPWMGWGPMLCQIRRDMKGRHRQKPPESA